MQRPLVSARYREFVPNGMMEFAAMAKGKEDLINFSLGDPDLSTSPEITRAAFAAAEAGATHYTDPCGTAALREAVADTYREDYDMAVSPEEVFITTSATHGMFLALQVTLEEGDEVILPAPYFTSYRQQVEMAGGVPVECPTVFEEGFQVTVERLSAVCTPRTRAIVLNTPCNPTGCCLSPERMRELAAFAAAHDLLVFADDIYTIFSYGAPFVPIASLPGMRERTITLNSFSKNFLMTGWRLGAVIAPREVVKALAHANEVVVYCPPAPSQAAGVYALRHRHEICPPIAGEYHRRLCCAAECIAETPHMQVLTPPGGTFYLFPDIRETGLTSDAVCRALLQEAHVLTLPGTAFGACGEGFLRLACTLGEDKIREAFARIRRMEIFR